MTGFALQPGGPGEPTFSLIVPVYNVSPFLPAFLESLGRQTGPLTDCELIFVNDGSTDGSADIIRTWMTQAPYPVQVVDQSNQGLCGARNTGLKHALGTWVSFPDPDDVLDPDYLRRVREFIADQTTQPDLVSTHILFLNDATGDVSDTHPLQRKFSRGNQLVDLEQYPDYIHLSAATGFYRRARIEDLGLRFDDSIRPNFEDAYFTVQYLCAAASPKLGIVADALYHYRRRLDASSLVQSSWTKIDKYTTVLERGYLRLLKDLAESRGIVPIWVQNTVLYDLLFYFRTDQSTNSATGGVKKAWTDRFHALTEQILSYIDVETIDSFSVRVRAGN